MPGQPIVLPYPYPPCPKCESANVLLTFVTLIASYWECDRCGWQWVSEIGSEKYLRRSERA